MEFEDLGKHCDYCRQKDILPFQCGNCKKYFCLQHIRIEEHKCEKKGINNNTIVICSKCGQAINLIPGVEPNILIDEHKQFKCRPVRTAVKVCAAKGCGTKLTYVNTYQCSTCKKEVCLQHRYKESHQCKEPEKQSTWKGSFLSALIKRLSG